MRGLTSAHPDFMLRFAQCTRGSKVRDESCGTDSVRMYGRRTPYEQSGGYNGIFPRLRPHREQCVGEPRATRRLTVYTEHRAGEGKAANYRTYRPHKGGFFKRAHGGSAHRTLPPHIFRDNGRFILPKREPLLRNAPPVPNPPFRTEYRTLRLNFPLCTRQLPSPRRSRRRSCTNNDRLSENASRQAPSRRCRSRVSLSRERRSSVPF